MRGKRILSLCLAAGLLLLCACGVQPAEKDDEQFRLYYAAPVEENRGGDAIASVTVPYELLPETDSLAQVEAAVSLMLHGGEQEDFVSPFPQGTTLRGVSVTGSTACVDFSGAYGQLSGMDLSLADYCLTLTLTQLPGIYSVRITSNGQELAYRHDQLFRSGDVLLSAMDELVRTLEAELYFFDADGALSGEARTLQQYEGQQSVNVVLSALLEGPESEALTALLPEDFYGMSAKTEAGVCHLNMATAALTLLEEARVADTMEAVCRSLLSLPEVERVHLYYDGAFQDEYR